VTITNWISLFGIFATLFVTLYFGYRRGELKKIKLYVTPSKLKKGLAQLKIFEDLKHKVPAVGVLNFLSLPNGKHKRICYHIFITIENPTKYHIEDVKLILLYPRNLSDENDKQFFKPTGNQTINNADVVYVDDQTIQVTYSYDSLHPKSVHQVIHPIIFEITDCFKELEVDDNIFFNTSSKGFSFSDIKYTVTAKNLQNPIRSHFWLINVIGNNEKAFFNREKKFLHAITKEFNYERYFFEKRSITKYKEGKFKKDVLVVETNDLNIGYFSFPPLKEPNGSFNFDAI